MTRLATRLTARRVQQRAVWTLEQAGMHPLLARLYAARGIISAEQAETQLKHLLPPDGLKGIAEAAGLLADAIAAKKRLLIVADYDCDGATACAVGIRGLRSFGAQVDYLVPNRFKTGYGLSPEVVDIAAEGKFGKPDIIITVDNGIASIAGVAAARRLGIVTIVTDHHLPGAELPDAAAIVNPNQPGCRFESKSIAGVGVMFYTLLALRAELRKRGAFADAQEPNLAALLDLVALGTVADVVKLERNNRILVAQGLARMRAGALCPGLRALFRCAGRDPDSASTFDLGFALGPRLNAAGRLADMSLGIECLITDDAARAMNIAQELDALNRERRSIEADMREDADLHLQQIDGNTCCSVSLFDPTWHQGVIGILAGRIKEQLHRPTFAFARADSAEASGELRGSGRSIPGLHLRDALDLVSKRHPDLLKRFGGHAAAAGVTIDETDLPLFAEALEAVARELISPSDLNRTLDTDGELEGSYISITTARLLQDQVWGQGFPQPLFEGVFHVERQRILKEQHLKLDLSTGKTRFAAIRFNFSEPVADRIRVAYRLSVNEFNGLQSVQLMLEHIEPA
ncbi:MAG: single-stranded-DNA-specific exonuclease RecJ [Georgfuchsia sp.]